jgi:N-acetylglutamate synthase-like GNAT family acetyltransferase
MTIRAYKTSDFDRCLEIFRKNTGKFFSPDEEQDFVTWLENQSDEKYWVIEEQGKTMGCGGIFVDDEKKTTGLAWGMIHPKKHKQGFGKALTTFRINKLRKNYPDYRIFVATSQHTVGFYENFGFVTGLITKDGFAPGLDKYEMTLSGKNKSD